MNHQQQQQVQGKCSKKNTCVLAVARMAVVVGFSSELWPGLVLCERAKPSNARLFELFYFYIGRYTTVRTEANGRYKTAGAIITSVDLVV